MLLPLNVQDYGPIYVNAKQYHGILRRRQYRAKVAQRKKITREKKVCLSSYIGSTLFKNVVVYDYFLLN